ncbi:MAG: AMP phosphorylase [Nanoarchaeota archaeon]|nr:AMP phosphorylase [Nanoarchaeota archaeon]
MGNGIKLRVKNLDLETGDSLVVLLNEEQAEKKGIMSGDRILLRKGSKKQVVIADLSSKDMQKGWLGSFEEVTEKMKLKDRDLVSIEHVSNPESVTHIKKKMDGFELKPKEIYEIIKDLIENRLSRVELTAFVSSIYIHGLSNDEIISLTKAMVKTGEKIKFKGKKIMEKHCIGGLAGNRTTMIAIPILAAAGLKVPKTSSRAITSPSGTADTMEVLAPVNVDTKKMKEIVNKVGACIVWGGALGLAPADDKIIKIEHPLRLDPEGQLIASILSKNLAAGTTHMLIDIPLGPQAKIRNIGEARHLENMFLTIAPQLGIKIKVVITEASQPIGNGIGPALEARDVLRVLKKDPLAPNDLREKSLFLASTMLEMAGKGGRALAEKILNSGEAYKKMKEIIKAQGGNPEIKPEDIRIGEHSYELLSQKTGAVMGVDNKIITKICLEAGTPTQKGSGVYLHHRIGDIVNQGEKLMTIYSESKQKLGFAKKLLKKKSPFKIS